MHYKDNYGLNNAQLRPHNVSNSPLARWVSVYMKMYPKLLFTANIMYMAAILKTPSSGKSTRVAKVYPDFFVMSDGLVHGCEE